MDTLQAIWSILTARQRRAAVVLLGLMLVGMALEVLGVGIVIPVLTLLTGDRAATDHSVVNDALAWLGRPTASQRVIGSLIGLVVIALLKAMYLLFAAFWHAQFVTALQSSMASRLLATYLTQPWGLHVQRHSAKMVQQVHEVQGFASVCSLAVITLSELFVLAGIVTLLVCLEPVGTTVVAGMFLLAAAVFEWFTRSRTQRWGATRLKHATLALQHIHQGIAGLKDAKVLGRESHFLRQFLRHSDVVRRVLWRQIFVSQIPRLWFELMAVTALCLLTAVLIWQGRPVDSLLPTLGLFATAAFRLLPSINRMSAAFHHLSFSAAMITRLRNELEAGIPAVPDTEPEPFAFEDAIAVDSVNFAYPGRVDAALSGVSLRIPRGASVGLIGGSGAGKSTFIDILLGLLPPTAGTVTVDGVDIQANVRGWQRLLGYVAQSIYVTDDTIRRNIAFGLPDELIDDTAVQRAIRAARLEEFVATLPEGLDTYVGERGVRFSGGQLQRVGIARALYHDPQVLVLDEATSSLDDATEREVMAAVNSLHGAKTLVIVAHRLSTVSGCDRLYRFDGGRIVRTGSFDEVVAS